MMIARSGDLVTKQRANVPTFAHRTRFRLAVMLPTLLIGPTGERSLTIRLTIGARPGRPMGNELCLSPAEMVTTSCIYSISPIH